MTYINDMENQADARERLRAEILSNVDSRREEALAWQAELAKLLGLITSAATIALLGFVGSRNPVGLSLLFSLLALAAFAGALLSHAYFIFALSQLHATRWSSYANDAHAFFTRHRSLEEMIESSSQLQAPGLYRLAFWIPFGAVVAGFILSGVALATAGPKPLSPTGRDLVEIPVPGPTKPVNPPTALPPVALIAPPAPASTRPSQANANR